MTIISVRKSWKSGCIFFGKMVRPKTLKKILEFEFDVEFYGSSI